MSAQATPTTDAPEPDAANAEPAIVQEFRERLLARHPDCDTVDAALTREEQRPSTTKITDEHLCPECGSRQTQRQDGPDMAHKTDTAYVCRWCKSHFDTPLQQQALGAWTGVEPTPTTAEGVAPAAVTPGRQTTLEGWE